MSAAQVEEYAKYIGLDLRTHPQLRWLAEEGLRCPLPTPWKLIADGATHYFYNATTGKSQWDHPMDDHYKQLVKTMVDREKSPASPTRKASRMQGGALVGVYVFRLMRWVLWSPLRCALQTTFFPRVLIALLAISAFHFVVYGVFAAVLSVDKPGDGMVVSVLRSVVRYASRFVPLPGAAQTQQQFVDDDDEYL